jgi:hypothetical protein
MRKVWICAWYLVTLLAGAGLGFEYAEHRIMKHVKATAIEHGCASYDARTGVWGWDKAVTLYSSDILNSMPVPERKPRGK